jgi:molybdopterin/thiamine biosynthesis adenylyltransferase
MANSRFHHEEIYRGKDLVNRLQLHRLLVCGAGALGSNLIDSLARMGFPNLRVVDKDRVEAHNINTQVYGDMDVGALKAEALKNRIFRHIGTEIEAVSKELTAANARAVLKGATLVVDAFDNTASRQLVQDECRARNIPCLHAGLYEDYGEVVWDARYLVPGPSAQGDVCDYPLARNIALLVVVAAAEEILDFCLAEKPRLQSWSITLKDLAIRPAR